MSFMNMEYEILNSLRDNVLVVDMDRTILFANKAFLDCYSLESKNIIGRKCHEISHQSTRPCIDKSDNPDCPLECPYEEVLRTGHSMTTNHTQLLPNSREMDMQISASPLYDDAGNIKGMIQVMRDVTKNNVLEKLILDAKREWECAMDASDDAMFLVGETGCILRANRAFFRMVESGPEEVIGRKCQKVFHPHDEVESCPLCEIQEQKRDETIIMEADQQGNILGKPLEIKARVVRDEHGWPTSVFIRLRDLTEQRKIEKELRRSKEKWERTFNAFTDFVSLLDSDLRFVKVNRKGCGELGFPERDIFGRHCYKLLRGFDEPCHDCPAVIAKQTLQPCTREINHYRTDKIFLVSASPVMDEKGNLEYIAHVAKDITEQKQNEESLFQALKMEAVGTLAGGIAHDFNNILSSIIGFAEFAKEEVPDGTQAQEDIDQVITSGLRAKELVRQLLDFSRRAPRQPDILSPLPIVKEALKMLHSTIPTSITIVEDLDSISGRIKADPIGLQQIILNLCTNAMHAIENQTGTIKVQLKETGVHEEKDQECLTGDGPFIVLRVQDTGCGMEKEILNKIFEPYFTTKEQGKGSGMGLAVVHGIVTEYDGCIHVDSTPGTGSIFSVYFPSTREQKHETLETKTKAEKRRSGGERILVVDDDPLLVQIHKRQLGKKGYEVTTTTDSTRALDIVRDRPEDFDLLITDQTMPGLTGTQLAQEVMSINPSLPIILCSGHSDSLSEKEALDYGIRKYVSKPIHKHELVDAVREVLDKHAPA